MMDDDGTGSGIAEDREDSIDKLDEENNADPDHKNRDPGSDEVRVISADCYFALTFWLGNYLI